MAIAPCSVCGQRYRGRATHIYPAALSSTVELREKLHTCPDCALSITAWAEMKLLSAQSPLDGDPRADLCICCNQPVEGQIQVFLTAYAPDRSDWWGRVHGEPCLTPTLASAGLTR